MPRMCRDLLNWIITWIVSAITMVVVIIFGSNADV